MSVWKDRKTWRWRVVRGGTPVSGSARTRAEANKQEAEATSRLDSGLSGKPILHSMEDAFARYLRSPEFLSLKSANDIAKTKIPPWKTYIEGKYLADASDVAEAAVRDWLKPRGKKPPLAIATINRRLAVLRRILSLAFRQWSWLDIDLSARIPLLAGETQRQTWLTNAESIRLRRACRPGQLRAVVTLLVCTGMRIGELLRIGPDDCRDGAIFLDARTKTGKPRVVPIIPPGSRYLHHLPITRSYDGLRSAFDLAKRRAGLPHIRMHDLRHTVGSQLAESGASLRDIQVWLGHTNPATTTRYTHIERARLDAVARNLLAHRKNKTLTT